MSEFYRSFDDEMRERFGGKVYRLALTAAHTCPNRDGSCGTGGCIFCSAGGSGDFAENAASIDEQIERAKLRVSKKLSKSFAGYMAYFQSFTGTYGDEAYLADCFEQAAARPEILALSIATRPDCISESMLQRLKSINERKPVYIELGLQTVHEDTARYINRCYELPVFEDAVRRIKEAGLRVVVHVIIGLPGEDRKRTAETVRYLAELKAAGRHIDGIKLQLLHVLRGTALAARLPEDVMHRYGDCDTVLQRSSASTEGIRSGISSISDSTGVSCSSSVQGNIQDSIYAAAADIIKLNDGTFLTCYNITSYAELITELIAMLPREITIHRITGDAPKQLLIWPQWTADKKRVLNTITKTFIKTGRHQGR